MSIPISRQVANRRPAAETARECRRIRLLKDRSTLEHRLEFVLSCQPYIHGFRFSGLATMGAYRAVEADGLVHATLICPRGAVTVVAATSRFMRKPDLRRRLFDLKRIAEARGQRILLLTARGLLNRMLRCRTTKPKVRPTHGHSNSIVDHRREDSDGKDLCPTKASSRSTTSDVSQHSMEGVAPCRTTFP